MSENNINFVKVSFEYFYINLYWYLNLFNVMKNGFM